MNPSAANVIVTRTTGRSVPQIGRTSITFAAAVAVAGVAAGCSSTHPAAAPRPAGSTGQSVTISATDDFRFSPGEVTVHPGTIRLTLKDVGTYPHNIAFPSLRRTSDSVSGSPGQQSTTFDITLTRPGRYDFVCTYHSSAGMKGTLVVLQKS